MNNKNIALLVGGVIVVIALGVFAYNNSADKNEVSSGTQSGESVSNESNDNSNTEAMMQKDGTATEELGESMASPTPTKDSAMMKGEAMTEGQVMKKDEQVMAAKAGSYKDYSTATVSAEQGAGNKTVLFFHAPWCPFCREADSAFKTSTDQIPTGVTVLKTDYDSNKELRQKYGVTYQHTFVQIDNSGKLVTKWNSGDIEMLQKNVK